VQEVIKSENPKDHWKYLKCFNERVLDLGCAYNDVDLEKTRENKLGTPHYIINQNPSFYVGIDSYSPDIDQLKLEFSVQNENVKFYCDSIDSVKKLENYIEKIEPTIIKSDIEGAETFFLGVRNIPSVLQMAIELHSPAIEKAFTEWALKHNFRAFSRETLELHNHISVVYFSR
jgi:hypothetical protein